jgi:hypothetical protein
MQAYVCAGWLISMHIAARNVLFAPALLKLLLELPLLLWLRHAFATLCSAA